MVWKHLFELSLIYDRSFPFAFSKQPPKFAYLMMLNNPSCQRRAMQRGCSSTEGEPATKQRRSWVARQWHQENNPWSGSESKRFKEAWCLRTFKGDYTGWNYWLVTYIAGPILPWSYGIRESTAEIKSKSRRKHKLLEVFDLTTTYEADIWPNELHFLTLFIKHQQTY